MRRALLWIAPWCLSCAAPDPVFVPLEPQTRTVIVGSQLGSLAVMVFEPGALRSVTLAPDRDGAGGRVDVLQYAEAPAGLDLPLGAIPAASSGLTRALPSGFFRGESLQISQGIEAGREELAAGQLPEPLAGFRFARKSPCRALDQAALSLPGAGTIVGLVGLESELIIVRTAAAQTELLAYDGTAVVARASLDGVVASAISAGPSGLLFLAGTSTGAQTRFWLGVPGQPFELLPPRPSDTASAAVGAIAGSRIEPLRLWVYGTDGALEEWSRDLGWRRLWTRPARFAGNAPYLDWSEPDDLYVVPGEGENSDIQSVFRWSGLAMIEETMDVPKRLTWLEAVDGHGVLAGSSDGIVVQRTLAGWRALGSATPPIGQDVTNFAALPDRLLIADIIGEIAQYVPGVGYCPEVLAFPDYRVHQLVARGGRALALVRPRGGTGAGELRVVSAGSL